MANETHIKIDVTDGPDNAIEVINSAIRCVNEHFGTNLTLAEME